MRLGTLSKAIRETAKSARLNENGLSITLPADMDGLDEYVKLQRIYMPAVKIAISSSGDVQVLELSSLPPAYRQVLENDYKNLLTSG